MRLNNTLELLSRTTCIFFYIIDPTLCLAVFRKNIVQTPAAISEHNMINVDPSSQFVIVDNNNNMHVILEHS